MDNDHGICGRRDRRNPNKIRKRKKLLHNRQEPKKNRRKWKLSNQKIHLRM